MTAPATAAEPSHPQLAETGRLLVVDDNEMNRDMLSRRLQRRGHAVAVAEDGHVALQMIDQQRFDLILLDIMMPGINGLEVLEQLRKTHSRAALPIIMATAKDDSSDIVGALKLGANDYVTKPLDFAVVQARVDTQLSLKRATDALSAAHARMKKDRAAAARVQHDLLPREAPGTDRANFTWKYIPCDELAGDALNVFSIDDRHIAIYIIDVSGHGVPASLLSVAVTRSLSLHSGRASLITDVGSDGKPPSIIAPSQVAQRLNDIYPMESNGGHYFTILYGVLDTHDGVLQFVSAGHPGPIVSRAHEPTRIVDVPDLPIGVIGDAQYEGASLQLRPGDRVWLHSDGFNEQKNAHGEQFNRQRLKDAASQGHAMALDESVAALVDQVNQWKGPLRFEDDLSLLAFEMCGQ